MIPPRSLKGKGTPISGRALRLGELLGALPKDEMEGRLLLNVIVTKRAAILELLAGEDQPRGANIFLQSNLKYRVRLS